MVCDGPWGEEETEEMNEWIMSISRVGSVPRIYVPTTYLWFQV